MNLVVCKPFPFPNGIDLLCFITLYILFDDSFNPIAFSFGMVIMLLLFSDSSITYTCLLCIFDTSSVESSNEQSAVSHATLLLTSDSGVIAGSQLC